MTCLLLSFTESWHHSDSLIPCIYDFALAREVAAKRPQKPQDWDAIAEVLNKDFSTVAATLPSAVLAVNDLNLTNDNM